MNIAGFGQSGRLDRLIAYVRAHAAYYAQIYPTAVPASLDQLPAAQRSGGSAAYDERLCCRRANRRLVRTFMRRRDTQAARFLGKYAVLASAGTQGKAFPVLHDGRSLRAQARALRSAFGAYGKRVAAVFGQKGFCAPASLLRQMYWRNPFARGNLLITGAPEDAQTIAEVLTAFKPDILAGFPGQLMRLLEEKRQGRLEIAPKQIVIAGETILPRERRALEDAFGCPVRGVYYTAECGVMAIECAQGHMHLCPGVWVEPVGADLQPADAQRPSRDALATQVFNRVQPAIRLQIGDRVVLHTEECACGQAQPWIDLLGREREVFCFGGLRVEPQALIDAMEAAVSAYVWCLRQMENETVVICIDCPEEERHARFKQALAALEPVLLELGVIAPRIALGAQAAFEPLSCGKFIRIAREY